MKRSNVNAGTRDEILADLKKSGQDRAAHGKLDRVREFARAHNAIESGAEVVRVRHAVWVVCDEDSPSDGEIAAAAVYAGIATTG